MQTVIADIEARIPHPIQLVPDALTALQALHKAIQATGIPPRTLELINLRASQINGCSVCVMQHPNIARGLGETDERLFAVGAWRDAPCFTDAERAALQLTEAVTRLADVAEPVPDEVWDIAADHYDERALAGLVLAIGSINVWNRVNVATRQVGGLAW